MQVQVHIYCGTIKHISFSQGNAMINAFFYACLRSQNYFWGHTHIFIHTNTHYAHTHAATPAGRAWQHRDEGWKGRIGLHSDILSQFPSKHPLHESDILFTSPALDCRPLAFQVLRSASFGIKKKNDVLLPFPPPNLLLSTHCLLYSAPM